MKKIISVILVLAMVLAISACGSDGKVSNTDQSKEESKQTEEEVSEDGTSEGEGVKNEASGEPLKVGFSLPSMTFPFYVRMYEQTMEEAEIRGWDVSFVDGNLDAGTQLNGLQDLINGDIDVIILATWFIDAMTDIFVQCEEKGIPVFVMDNMVIPAETETAVTFTTGTDNFNAGAVGGTWYATYLKSKNITDLKMVTVSTQTEQTVKRYQGFIEALSDNGINVEVLNKYDGGEREKALKASEDALIAYAELELIYGASAQDSLGAYDATAGSGRDKVAVIGFDGEEDEILLIDEGTNYLATITQDPKGQAKLLTSKVDQWLAGEKFDQITETPAGVYTFNEGQLTGEEVLERAK